MHVRVNSRSFIAAWIAFMMLFLAATKASSAGGPSIAIIGINNDGMDPWWGAAFDPGKAFADMLADQLVNANSITIVDRAHIDTVFAEQKLAQSGDFSQENPVKLGHMLGANFLIVGRVLQLDKVGSNENVIGGHIFGRSDIGGIGTSGDKIQLHLAVQVIDSNTGRIMKSMRFDKTMSGKGFVMGDLSNSGLGGYQSKEFASSVVGKLMIGAAQDISKQVLAIDFAGKAGPSVEGLIIAVQGDSIIINKGSADQVTRGMYFDVSHALQTKDPASGKVLTTNLPAGVIQVISVDKESAVARLVSGKISVQDNIASK